MCLEFDLLLCFGLGKRKQDWGTPHLHARPPHDHRHQLPVADEEYRRASNDARRPATKEVHGYPAGAQEKAYAYSAADGTLGNHPAKDAHYHYYYQERQPAHKQPYYHDH